MRKKKSSYGTDIYDISMVLDEPRMLNRRGLRKRRGWVRRGLIK